MVKTCTICRQEKELQCFHKNKATKDGHLNHCAACRRTKQRAEHHLYQAKRVDYYNANKERLRQRLQESYSTPEAKVRRLISSAKNRSIKKGIPFNLSVEDLEIPTVCKYLGLTLIYNQQNQNCAASATLDRIVPSKGYVKGNVQIISHLANGMKQNATQEQLVAFALSVLKSVNESIPTRI